jgi:uncharacterized protein YjiS (DUF1127 family)
MELRTMKGQRGFIQVQQSETATGSHPSAWRLIGLRLSRWYQLGQQRRALAALSDNALKDLGLSRADIHEESERPFWDDPLRK